MDGTNTNVEPTNVGHYKGQAVQTLDLKTLDWYKLWTDTNAGLVQLLDQYSKDGRTLVEFEKKTLLYEIN